MNKPKGGIRLSTLIQNTASDLRAARAQDEDAVMQFQGCEIELAVSIAANAKGGIRFWVIEAGADVSGETVSRIKLSFGPIEGQPAPAFYQGPAAGRPHGKTVESDQNGD